ncbi:MAG: ABC transporter permease, partial [Gammaproteobacteria bacterium]
MIKPVILWTDALVFLLTLVVIGFVLYARRKPHLAMPWRRVISGRIAAASAVVLLAFVLTGLLDSLHFRVPLDGNGADGEVHYAVEVLSVLDVLVGPLRTQVEKTYSAPFATHLYAMEMVELEDGTQARVYPPLQYGGAHLAGSGLQKSTDILQRSLRAMAGAVLGGVVLLWLVAAWLGRR